MGGPRLVSWGWAWVAVAAVPALGAAVAGGATLEDMYGDCSNSSCTGNACPLEQKILDRGSGTYDYPTPAVTSAILAAVDFLLAGDPASASTAAAPGGYKVTAFADTVRQRTFQILEPIGPTNPGHGYFVFDLAGNRNQLIEVPHPGFDTDSVDFGLHMVTRSKPFAFLIAGADRYTNYTCSGCNPPCTNMPGRDDSDVVRTTQNLFHQVHQRLLDQLSAQCRSVYVVQPHGFGLTTQQQPGCAYNFVLSDGDGSRTVDPPHLLRLGGALGKHTLHGTGLPQDAYTWNIASNSGNDCSALVATQNEQAAATRAAGQRFASMEMEAIVRGWPDAADAAEVANAVAEAQWDDYLVGAGLGQPNGNEVRVYDASGVATTVDFFAYGAGKWGTLVAGGDVDGDAADDILTGPGPGDVFGPQVRGYKQDATPIAKINYYAYGTLKYGVNVATAGLDADRPLELLTAAGPGVVFGPHVRGFNYDGIAISPMTKISFFAYGTLKYGGNVTAGTVDSDCFAELVTGPGPGVIFGPQVRGFNFDGTALAAIAKINFNAFSAAQYGANAAAGDADNDRFDEIAAAPGPGPSASFPAQFRAYNYDGAIVALLPAFDVTAYTTWYGGRVGLGDVGDDAREDLLVGAGRDPAADSSVKAYRYDGAALTRMATTFLAFPGTSYGVNVASSALGQ